MTSIGQRGYLIDYFRESLGGFGEIYGADATPFAPAFARADASFVILPCGRPAICTSPAGVVSAGGNRRSAVDQRPGTARSSRPVSPTCGGGHPGDCELPRCRGDLLGKHLTARFLADRDIRVPVSVTDEEVLAGGVDLVPPVIAKPRRGSRSQGIEVFTDMDGLIADARASCASRLSADRRRLYQEFLGGDQYSLHVFNDADGRPVRVVGIVNPIPHMSGETYHLETVADPDLLDLGWRIGRAVGHVGPLWVDVHMKGDEFVVLELNPCFGGGYPVSHFAGADFTGMTVALAAGDSLTADQGLGFQPGVVALKQFTAHATTRAEIDRSVRRVSE